MVVGGTGRGYRYLCVSVAERGLVFRALCRQRRRRGGGGVKGGRGVEGDIFLRAHEEKATNVVFVPIQVARVALLS